MLRVYSNPDPAITHLVRNALDQIGVQAVVQGGQYGAALGEVPPVAAWSEVWVPDDGRLDEVRAIVAEVLAEPEAGESWACGCGETVEGQFGSCWSCGAPAPEPA